ncbi:MAG: gluconate 2-dehydrogenase subunit 3 family protein [Streptosporangiaceae bacterium]
MTAVCHARPLWRRPAVEGLPIDLLSAPPDWVRVEDVGGVSKHAMEHYFDSNHGTERRLLRWPAAGVMILPVTADTPGSGGVQFFSSHQAAVVEDATARLAPGPQDDPAEAGHPGAREANVTGYIDTMLNAFSAGGQARRSVPVIFAGGPWSNRHASGPDHLASFIPPDPAASIAWHKRLAGWRRQYADGIATLDKLAGGDFTRVSPAHQDEILARQEVSSFMSLLFGHTIEGLYSVPEYSGNRGLAGWKDIGYPGDSQPRGYTAEEVERSDGPDALDDSEVVAAVLKFLGAL